MNQKQKDVIEVAKDLVSYGAVVQIPENVFGFGLHFIPIDTGGFKVIIQSNKVT